MASIRWHIQEVFFLRQTELLSLLMSIKNGEATAESTMRVVHVIRYAFLNLRFVIEQLAFGMALAHYDSIKGKGLLNWNPKTIIAALETTTATGFYPKPVDVKGEHLAQRDFLGLYGQVNSVLHTRNPLKMEQKALVDRRTTAPAMDAKWVLTQARRMTEALMGIRNLLVEHLVLSSFRGCDAWLVRMCDDQGQIHLSTRFRGDSVECNPTFHWRDEEGMKFWRHGDVP